MNRPNKIRSTAVVFNAILAGLMLSACNPNKEIAGPPVINGEWASNDGIFTARFLNGNFQAVANDTGNVISQGKYIIKSDASVNLKWNGLVSGRSNEANCTRSNDNQLDCVDVDGKSFSLQRVGTAAG